MNRLLFASPGVFFHKYSAISEGVGLLMRVPQCFLCLGNFFSILGNIALVNDCSTLFRRLYCRELLQFCIVFCFQTQCNQTLAETLFCLFASFLGCFAPAITREKRHQFSISSIISVYKLVFLQGIRLLRDRKILLLAFTFILF